MTTLPGRNPANTPVWPFKTCSTIALVGSMVNTRSD